MSFRAPGLLRIPQWSIVNRLVTAEDVTFDQYGVQQSRVRTDLTGGVVYLTVRDDDGTVVIQKDSSVVSEIEIKNQGVAATKGQATIKFVEADTAPLTPGAKYWFDIWAKTADGREEPIVDRGRFHVDRSTTHISEGPAPSLPAYPASQTPQLRSFKWVAPAGGDSFTVTIPGSGMVDATYIVVGTYSTIPVGGAWAAIYCPETSRTVAAFGLETSAPILAGTVIDFILRDVA